MIFNSIKKITPALCLLISLLAVPAWAGTAEQEVERAAQLNQQADALYQQGKLLVRVENYPENITFAR